LFPGDRNGENTEMVNCSKIISDNPELLRMVYFRVTVSIYPSYRNITPNVVGAKKCLNGNTINKKGYLVVHQS
jgi:hypothetical protein